MTEAFYQIPLAPGAQRLSIMLAGANYRLALIWRGPAGWLLDVADDAGNALVRGVPLVTGCDLLAPHRHLGIRGALIVLSSPDAMAAPGYADLGDTAGLYFFTP